MANYTASDITTDEQAALDQIKEETEAAVKYDIAAKNAKDPVTKKAMEHNKKDEIEHAGLMGAVAVRENPENKTDMMAGVKELDKIKTETVEDSFIKKSNKDLNEGKIIIDDLLAIKHWFADISQILGIDFFANDDETSGDEEELLNIIADVRQKLRAEKKYDLSDEIRDKLVSLGIEVSD